MDWKLQLGISIIVPIISSILTYLAAIKKSKDKIETVRIKSDTEIKKIKEESEKEIKNIELEYENQIKKMKIETEEQIKIKIAERDIKFKENEERIKSEVMGNFIGDFMKNPKQGAEKLKSMQEIAEMFKPKS